MRQTSFAPMHCSLARSLERVGDWWSPLILRDLSLGLSRFDELADDLGISRNLLASRLTHLVEHGIIERREYQQNPVRHEYHLADAGRDLVPILQALTAWGDRWAGDADGPPIRFRHARCGEVFVPNIACSACGEPVRHEDVEAVAGPGGRVAAGTNVVGRLLAGH